MSISAAVLQRLQGRASQADQIVLQLRAQLQQLKTNAGVYGCKAEEKKLTEENAAIKVEIESLKTRLVKAEINNEVPQVALPNGAQAAAVPAAAAAVAAVQTPKKLTEQPIKKEKAAKKDKPKKNPEPAADAAPIDVSRLDMRIGYIVSAKKHPDADGLYVEEVDVGEEKPRTIISGLVKHIPLEQMQERFAIFLLNLKPAKMRGIMSEGMIMCGSTPEKVEIIQPPPGVVKGDRVVVEGFPGNADAMLNPKKKIWEQVQPDLKITSEGLAAYKGQAWEVKGKGQCRVPSLRDVIIK